jgi:hypothetical protein
MTLRSTRRSTNWQAGAALLLAVVVPSAPGPAQAACNHLVLSRSRTAGGLHHLDELILVGSPAGGKHASSLPGAPEPRHRSPCSGLSCSGSLPLSLPTIVPVPDGRDRWGHAGEVVLLQDPPVYAHATDEPAAAPAGEAVFVFHPPRV